MDGLSPNDSFLFQLEGGFSTICSSSPARPDAANDAKNQRRKNIMKEMLDTEKTYLEFLQTIIVLFVTPLKRSIENDKPPIISKEDFQSIFQNIEDIQKLNAELLKKMAQRPIEDNSLWADILITVCSEPTFRNGYQTYVNGYNKASTLVTSSTKAYEGRANNPIVPGSKEAFGQFLKEKLTHKLCIGFGSLTSFLITPVQRLPRYLLFLKDLQKCTDQGHPDYQNIIEASNILSSLTAHIDHQKELYDKFFRIEALFQLFSQTDRQLIQSMTDPVRDLIAEAPLLEGTKNPKLRYILLFSDLFICATKVDNTLQLEWKVDLYNSDIETIEEDGRECFRTISQKKITEYPFTLNETHYLFAFEKGKYDVEYWKEKIAIANGGRKNLRLLSQNANFVCVDMQNHLLSERDLTNLFQGGECVNYLKGELIRKQHQQCDDILLIKEGFCLVEKKVGSERIPLRKIGVGEFIGEMAYLSKSQSRCKPSSANVRAHSDSVTILRITFSDLDKVLQCDPYLARRFFQLLCVILSNRFIGESITTSGWGASVERDVPSSDSSNEELATSISLLHQLKLPLHEVIVQKFNCSLKKLHLNGELYILREHVCFLSKIFGFNTRYSFYHQDIQSADEVEENVIRIQYQRKKKSKAKYLDFEMKNNPDLQMALNSINGVFNRNLSDKPNPMHSSHISITHIDSIYPLTHDHWTIMRTISDELTFKKDDVVLKQGSITNYIYQIVQGTCRVEVEMSNGTSKVMGYVAEGEIFGEISFIMGLVASATIIADQDCSIIALKVSQLEQLLFDDPALAAGFYLFTSRLLRKRLAKMQRKNLREIATSS